MFNEPQAKSTVSKQYQGHHNQIAQNSLKIEN